MEAFESDTPCSAMAVDCILRVSKAGVIWGLCTGPYDATKLGLVGLSRASFVAKCVGQTGAQCGFFAGVFASTRCGIQKYRGKTDLFNSAAAGAIAGGLMAAATRNGKQVAGIAALASIVCAAGDYSRTL